MLPTEVIMNPVFTVIRELGLYDSLAGIIIPSINTATGIFMFRTFFVSYSRRLNRIRTHRWSLGWGNIYENHIYLLPNQSL